MTNLPTLLRKGFIVPPKWMSESDQRRLTNVVSIDYILKHIADRIPEKRGAKVKIQPKKYGDRVIILKSETGSGKSTTLPAKLYTTFFERTKKNVLVTQPRVLTAIDLPSTIVPYVPALELDKNIGYNTGPFKRLPVERGIIFSTVGVLTQQLIMNTSAEFMKGCQFVIIDEVHERDIDTDLCLFLLKKLLEQNYESPECPLVILTSATFDERIFMEYFDVPDENYIQVVGSTFPIEPNFPEYSVANYLKYATLKAQKLHLDNLADLQADDAFRDIIIFIKDSGVGKKIYEELLIFNSKVLDGDYPSLTKYREELEVSINTMYKKGGDANISKTRKYYILPILLDTKSFQAGGLEYQNLFSNLDTIHVPLWDHKNKIDITQPPQKYVNPTRRIIIATNIAETGVTIPTLKYCIDTGYHLNVEFHPDIGCSAIFAKNVTKGMAIQRRGRVGRKAPGYWYPCYTEETYEALPSDQFSKIIVNDTAENLLSILIKEKRVGVVEESSVARIRKHREYGLYQMFPMMNNKWYSVANTLPTNISSLDFIELPSIQTLGHSVEKLHILGFLDDSYNITPIGFYANQIRFISLELRRMLFAGYYYGANVLDLITIAAFTHTRRRYIFKKTFKLTNFLKSNDADFEFYNRILIADDFINCIFVWNIFQNFIQKNMIDLTNDYLEKLNTTDKIEDKKILYLRRIQQWCDDNDIIADGLIGMSSMRDGIIENMITIGLNPYKNSLGLPKNLYNLNKIIQGSLAEGLDEVKKLKHCIFEGFKSNILLRTKTGYISCLKNIPIKVKSPFISELNEAAAEQPRPNSIVVDSYAFSQKFGSEQFEFLADGFVSVLDNYIDADDKFFVN
jgi:HrpA-like RNA helicase